MPGRPEQGSRGLAENTIAALATPPGPGAIAAIRLSGSRAIAICDQVFRGKRIPSEARDRSVLFGEIVDRDGSPIDQVLLVIMRGPQSLTGEDVVELTCHGGVIAPKLVLRRLIEEGARPADPGEFTKRAFLNGKLDLAQAEAVSEIVHASSEKALNVALRQLKGELSKRLTGIEASLLDWLALVEANIDFVDEEVEGVDTWHLSRGLGEVRSELEGLLATHEQGKYIKDGLDVVIVGKPNVGKSSLFNRLVGGDRVIVSGIPGTTRDVVDGLASVNGLVLKVHDTAGVRDGTGPIEEEAVRRTRAAVEDADLALVVIDVSTPLSVEDYEILEEAGPKAHLVVVNKTDLPAEADLGGLKQPVRISALRGWGLEELLESLREMAHMKIDELTYEIIVGERHAACIRDSLESLSRAIDSIRDDVPLEFIASDIRYTLDCLGGVTGRKVSTRVLDEIFSRFCIGK